MSPDGAPKARWIIQRRPVEGVDALVVIYADVGSGQRIPLCSFDAGASEDVIIQWIIESGRICVADEIITTSGDVLMWLPVGLRVRRLQLGGLVFEEKYVVSA